METEKTHLKNMTLSAVSYTHLDVYKRQVIRIAEKHGISVPANEFLYCRAKEIEASYHE